MALFKFVKAILPSLLATLFCVSLYQTPSNETVTETYNARRTNEREEITCGMLRRDVQYDGAATGLVESWVCEVESMGSFQRNGGQIRELEGLSDWITNHERELVSGESHLTIPEADLDDRKVRILPREARFRPSLTRRPRTKLSLRGGRRGNRNLEIVEGKKEVLVIRVIANDAHTTASMSSLSESVFGDKVDVVTLRSQYQRCSHGKLEFLPTTDTRAVEGVVEVKIDHDVIDAPEELIRDAVIDAATSQLGDMGSQYDHVMLCLPPGTNGTWAAYAFVNHWMTVFNDEWCRFPSAQMHEIGHNLNLDHSAEGDASLADQSGLMGYSYRLTNSPKMCFNGAKSWKLGWYSDRHVTVHPMTASWQGTLIGVADYSNHQNVHHVIVKIEAGLSDYFVAFNRRRGFNSDSMKGADQVLISKQGLGYSPSLLEGILGAGDEYVINDFQSSGEIVTVRVNSINADSEIWFADVSVAVNVVPTISPAPTPSPVSCGRMGLFTCEITTDLFPEDTSWTLMTNEGTLIREGGGYINRESIYADEECLPFGSYVFTIHDVYGDGNCCATGQGGYVVTLDGIVISTGGEFESMEAFELTVGGIPASQTSSPTQNPTTSPSPYPTQLPTIGPTETRASFHVFYPSADTYVWSGDKKNSNFGSANVLSVKYSQNYRNSILKFDFGDLTPTSTTRATLHLRVAFVGGDSSRIVKVNRMANVPNWDEMSVTWSNLNGNVQQVGANFPVTSDDIDKWVVVDVSDLLQVGSSTLVLMLEINSTTPSIGSMCSFSSREVGKLAPELMVVPNPVQHNDMH